MSAFEWYSGLAVAPDSLSEGLELDFALPATSNLQMEEIPSSVWGPMDVTMPENDLNLQDLLEEGMVQASVVDLEWLEKPSISDPPELRSTLDELEELWSKRKGSPLHRVPALDREAASYARTLEADYTPPEREVDDLFWVRKALRLSHYQRPITEIRDVLVRGLGDTGLARQAFLEIAKGYGLAGNVYVQASAFPGLKNGKWVKELRAIAKTARYVITEDASIAQKLGMVAVSTVPWEEAGKHYLPALRRLGYRVASTGSIENRLRSAFLRGPRQEKVAGSFPVHVAPADRVSPEKAMRWLVASAPADLTPLVRDQEAPARARVLAKLQSATNSGFLSHEDMGRLSNLAVSPAALQKVGERLIALNTRVQSRTYEGSGLDKRAYLSERDAEWAKIAEAELREKALLAARSQVVALAKAGQLTAKQAAEVVQGTDPKQMLRLAAQMVQDQTVAATLYPAAKRAKLYEGTVQTEHTANSPSVKGFTGREALWRTASKQSGIRVSEFRKLEQWLRRAMSEGAVGQTLDSGLSRFAAPLRKAASSLISSLRDEHEGLSGFVYVDAGAYDPSKGCAEGVGVHRASKVPAVQRIAQCQSCVHARGEDTCSRYKKMLVGELSPALRALKAENLMPAEIPLEVSEFDPMSFQLQDSLSTLDLMPETPHEKLLRVDMSTGDLF